MILKGVEPKMMQINLTGFLESNAKVFVKELWILLLSAQNSVGGIPAIFLEQKKEELRIKKEKEDQRRAERDSVMETIKKRRWDEKEDLRGSRESRFDQRRRSNSRERGRRSYSRSPKRNYSRSPRRQYSRSPPRRHRSPHDDRYRSSRDDRRRDDRYRRTDDYYRDRPEHRESRRRD
ncbi:hypothetical protein G6F56_011952 [Rhizopus delemar]|nr:hypothetical protein G6F56_011952 [Rhizopus delemar]